MPLCLPSPSYRRRYNFLLYVPYQLERLIEFGTWLCLDSLVAVVTVMPLRAVAALLQASGLAALPARLRARPPTPQPSSAAAAVSLSRASSSAPPPATPAHANGPAAADEGGSAHGGGGGGAAHHAHKPSVGSGSRAASLGSGGAARVGGAGGLLAGNQVYDILCLFLLVSCTAALRAVKPGFIYYWLKVRLAYAWGACSSAEQEVEKLQACGQAAPGCLFATAPESAVLCGRRKSRS